MSEVLNFILYSAIPFIFALGILIFVHELGHFLLAKLVGIRVERFSLGYPPRMFGKKIGDTDYCISWIPLGGYVKLSGMIDESLDANNITGAPHEFMSKPVYQRFLVIFAGPLMNVLLAVFIIAGFAYSNGLGEIQNTPVVGEVMENKPAQIAGIKPGDTILRINDKPINTWEEIVQNIRESQQSTPIEIVWLSDGQEITKEISPTYSEKDKAWLIGISPSYKVIKLGLFGSLGHGFRTTWMFTREIVKVIGKLITRSAPLKETVGGPIRIFDEIGKSAKRGWDSYIGIIALISLNLGIFNLLPIPVLDGGHLVYLLIEAIIRRPIPPKVKLIIQQIGMALLLILIVLVTINDIRR